MDYFVVRPNYTVLSKYFDLAIPKYIEDSKDASLKNEYLKSLTKEHSQNGLEILIDAYTKSNNPDLMIFGPEHIELVCEQFNSIVLKYGLEDHKEELLYMILKMVQSFNSYHYLQNESFHYNERMRVLSHYLLAFKEMPYDREYELILKAKDSRTNVIKENVTIKDQKLIAWMSKFVIDAIDNCEAPVYLFGINENAILRKRSSGPPTIKQLKQAASTKSKKYSPDLNKQSIGQFCLELLPFLNNETSLKAKEGKKTSDRQLSFLYEVCKLFDLIDKDFDTDSLDVTPIKHMRTLLSDSRKAINKKR